MKTTGIPRHVWLPGVATLVAIAAVLAASASADARPVARRIWLVSSYSHSHHTYSSRHTVLIVQRAAKSRSVNCSYRTSTSSTLTGDLTVGDDLIEGHVGYKFFKGKTVSGSRTFAAGPKARGLLQYRTEFLTTPAHEVEYQYNLSGSRKKIATATAYANKYVGPECALNS
jgi:hypothetical protein